MEQTGLRSWGGSSTTGLALPLAALAAALLVFLTAGVSVGLVGMLVVALVPWALLAGQVRVGPWPMAVLGVGVPALVTFWYDAPGAIFLALLTVTRLAAMGGSWPAEAVACVGAVAVPVALVAVEGEWREDYPAVVFFGTGTLFTWVVGRILRRERQLVAALTEAHDRLDVAAAAAERRRIAHDVHDAVGHGLTVVLLNLVGARQVLERDPVAAAEALDRAEQVGRDSLRSVRAIVGLLRDPGESGARPPQPGAAEIVDLVRDAAAAGLPVRAEVAGDLRAVDAYAGLVGYRIVQEAISNVQHHAPGAEAVVRVVRHPDHLTVSVRNGAPAGGVEPTGVDDERYRPGPATGRGGAGPDGMRQRVGTSGGTGLEGMRQRVSASGGTGLEGMRQRVGALGGTVSAGPDGDGWLVEASLPVRRTEEPPMPVRHIAEPSLPVRHVEEASPRVRSAGAEVPE
ncbi:two-component sensor histidine kinase [Plantactinospora endophytica]|uniref:histidine kinase n=1 Tax=Plantactinospora endophytica TaxID=673535 RepID=A0ABQ4EC06_9ACTN|nr:histidine kinase [Plantactinospora endophytica]GIG92244.1 two-component sensor histidine kinase [Plantactinospora endophytica]